MRPAFFGEVMFPRSRAVDMDFGDDFDEDVPSRNEVIVETKSDISKKLPAIKYLIIACGIHPSNFSKVHLIPDQPKAEVAVSLKVLQRIGGDDQNEHSDGHPAPISVLDFYFVPKTNALVGVTVSKYAPIPEAANAVVKKLFEILGPHASSIKTYVLDFKPSTVYQTFNRESIEDRLSTYGIVRVLMTTKEKSENKDSLIPLEMPNMIDGLAGSVITHCEVNGLRAMAIILYGPDSSDAFASNIDAYRTRLEQAELWKSVFFRQEHEAGSQARLEALVRQNVPVTSMFG